MKGEGKIFRTRKREQLSYVERNGLVDKRAFNYIDRFIFITRLNRSVLIK